MLAPVLTVTTTRILLKSSHALYEILHARHVVTLEHKTVPRAMGVSLLRQAHVNPTAL